LNAFKYSKFTIALAELDWRFQYVEQWNEESRTGQSIDSINNQDRKMNKERSIGRRGSSGHFGRVYLGK
jgi:hypothetical protein